MIILMAQERAKWFLAAMVMFALPILDTALAFARRWVNGRPLFSADKQHFHHQLVARGLHRQADGPDQLRAGDLLRRARRVDRRSSARATRSRSTW